MLAFETSLLLQALSLRVVYNSENVTDASKWSCVRPRDALTVFRIISQVHVTVHGISIYPEWIASSALLRVCSHRALDLPRINGGDGILAS